MRAFSYERVPNANAATQAAAAAGGEQPSFLAGGTTLFDLMKLEVMRPQTVIDINPLDRTAHGRITVDQKGLHLGALVRMADAADHADVQRQYPVIAQALKLAASQQIRNMASLGGNVLQRTRCTYFRDVSYAACNRRNPGSGCAALEGVNRMHAVLGGSDHCIAAYAGDFGQALIALDASVEIAGPGGTRTIPFAKLHRPPGDRPGNNAAARRPDCLAHRSGRAMDAPFALSEGPRSGVLRIRPGLSSCGARSPRRNGA
jgi:xanthine dehydrogenase YagS FAD-binding subunit